MRVPEQSVSECCRLLSNVPPIWAAAGPIQPMIEGMKALPAGPAGRLWASAAERVLKRPAVAEPRALIALPAQTLRNAKATDEVHSKLSSNMNAETSDLNKAWEPEVIYMLRTLLADLGHIGRGPIKYFGPIRSQKRRRSIQTQVISGTISHQPRVLA